MNAMLARALRALADRLSPPKSTTINMTYVDTTTYVDGRAIVRAVERAAHDRKSRR